MTKQKNLLRIALFGVVLAVILVLAGVLLNPGKRFKEGRIVDRNARDAEIETVPPQTIDIYNIGNSLAMVGISPMDLWNNKGYTSFNLCKGAAETSEAYYLLKKGLQYQSPKVVMIETNMMLRTEGDFQDAGVALTEFYQYFFPFCRFHNVWKTIGSKGSLRKYYMGYLVSEHIVPYEGPEDYMEYTEERKELPRFSVEYMDRIIDLCKDRGIQVIMYSLCSPKCYDTPRINALKDYAMTRGVKYVNLNRNWRQMGIDWSHDTRDGGDHLNEYGVAKVTKYIGNYLAKKCDLPDHRGEEAYADWDVMYASYLETLKEMEGKSYYMIEGDEIYD